MTNVWRKILVAFFWGGAIVAFACLLQFEQGEEFKHFCDAFSLAGVALLSVAGCVFLRAQGAFLGIGYLLERIKEMFLPTFRKKNENYDEYRKRKTEAGEDGRSS